MRISSINQTQKYMLSQPRKCNSNLTSFKNRRGAMQGAGVALTAGIAAFMPFAEFQSAKPDFSTTLLILICGFVGAIMGDIHSGKDDDDKNLG